jgi:8-oxo-dGTP diphosphatase
MKKKINVVAAIIENDKAEILCALRSSTMSLPNLWEFPGGKVDNEESEIEALKREIKEELLCEIDIISRFDDYTHEYEQMIIQLITYKCQITQGAPSATEHAKLIWLKREYFNSLVWAPADISTLDKLIKEQ